MRRLLLLPLLLATLLTNAGLSTVAAAADETAIAREADWLLRIQGPDGALPMNLGSTDLNPYFANIGAHGLARAAIVTGYDPYANAAYNWLRWYQARMDANGYVDDHTRSASGWVPSHTVIPGRARFDSTDAYAATFLSAAAEWWRATGDGARLAMLQPAFVKAIAAIDSTKLADGLTEARPGYPVAYLMDNVEVYEGLLAATELFAALGDTARANAATAHAAAVRTALDGFWSTADGGYRWARFRDGSYQPMTWDEFYPSALAQAWIVSAGLTTPARATFLMARFEIAQPDWDEPLRLGWHFGAPPSLFPIGWHPRIASAFATAGMGSRAHAALITFEARADLSSRLMPFHVGTAGSLIVLASDPKLAAGRPPIASARWAGALTHLDDFTAPCAWQYPNCLLP